MCARVFVVLLCNLKFQFSHTFSIKIEIGYAREAKRINVKQLKTNIWQELTTVSAADEINVSCV